MKTFILSNRLKRQDAFTIVELLIVVVVIAILAAITVVSYNGIANRAHDTAVKTDLRNMANKLEIYKVGFGGYPAGPTSNDGSMIEAIKGLSISADSYATEGIQSNFIYCFERYTPRGLNIKYAVVALSKSKRAWVVTSDKGVSELQTSFVDEDTACADAGIPEVNGVDGVYGYNNVGYHSGDGLWRPWTGVNN